MTKKSYLVIDTETLSDYVFDVGYTMVDRAGNVLATGSYVVEEVITDPITYNAFGDRFMGGEKIANYYYNLFMGTNFEVKPFGYIRAKLNELATGNVVVCAYNSAFDAKHLDLTAKHFGYDKFFNYDVQWWDLWHIAMATLLDSVKFAKFVAKHERYTDKGNAGTGAEVCYQFITDEPTFEEEHTAFADSQIEAAILERCFKTHRKLETEPVGFCTHNKAWQRVQAKAKAQQ